MNDKILLSGVHLVCHIGVPDEERAQAQGLILDLEMGVDLRRAGASDRFEDTVDYAAVREVMIAAGVEPVVPPGSSTEPADGNAYAP